jgi:hypothetical protein
MANRTTSAAEASAAFIGSSHSSQRWPLLFELPPALGESGQIVVDKERVVNDENRWQRIAGL